MHRGEIQGQKLVVTRLVSPADTSVGDIISVDQMEDGVTTEYNLHELGQVFSAITTTGFSPDDLMLYLRNPEDPFESHVSVFGVSLSEVFHEASGFRKISSLQYGVPIDVAFGEDFEGDLDQMLERSRQFSHSLLTQALERGDRSEENVIWVEYEGSLPERAGRDMHVDVGEALLFPADVDYIEDKGAYRKIYMKGDREEKHRSPVVVTEMSKVELEQILELNGSASPAPESETPAPGLD